MAPSSESLEVAASRLLADFIEDQISDLISQALPPRDSCGGYFGRHIERIHLCGMCGLRKNNESIAEVTVM
jgi:hypothetical protein